MIEVRIAIPETDEYGVVGEFKPWECETVVALAERTGFFNGDDFVRPDGATGRFLTDRNGRWIYEVSVDLPRRAR